MGRDEGVAIDSSILVKPIAIFIWLAITIVAALFSKTALALFFGFVFVFSGGSFLWGRLSLRDLEYEISMPAGMGVFPGQKIRVVRTLSNNKMLPLAWLEMIEPCSESGCIASPRDGRYSFSLLKWQQSLKFSDLWEAKARGVFKIDRVEVRSGDGFGMCALHKTLSAHPPKTIFVYPRLREVLIDRILMDMWDTRSACLGYLKDITLLKTVRAYAPQDPAKAINQRLLARGQGLMVNQYEVVSPDSVLFILDAASFAGGEPEEIEETLSILASLMIGLFRKGVGVGLCAPASCLLAQTFMEPSSAETGLRQMMQLLSAASANDPSLVPERFPAPEQIGYTYYVCRSMKTATCLQMLMQFPEHKGRALVYEEQDAEKSYVPARSLRSFEGERAG